ncbi:MAG: DUF4352 domain-containing protein [Candidatus Saccharibacteria bacterium]|jgi:hypothetical protein
MNKVKKATKKHVPRAPQYRHRQVSRAVVIGMIVAWAVIGILTGVYLINNGKMSQFGSDASAGKANLVVTNVQYDAVGKQPYLAPPGLKFAIATVTITNASSERFDFAPVLQTKVIDEKGQEWPMSPAMMDKPIQAGPFPVNATRTGQLSFLIPADAQKVTFVFDPLTANGAPAKFILGQK